MGRLIISEHGWDQFISLEPFTAGGGRAVTERNMDDISAILDVSAQDHYSMDVSWGSGAGKSMLTALSVPRVRSLRSGEEALDAE